MNKFKTYWIWGLFPPEETNLLKEIKDKVQSKLTSPFFETHITLAGPYSTIDNSFVKQLKAFVENNAGLILNVKGYDFKQEMFESFYISIKNSENLDRFRENIYELKKFDLNREYSPHISLSYGNHEIKEKFRLISKLPVFKKTIQMSKIALVEVGKDIKFWKILAIFNFN